MPAAAHSRLCPATTGDCASNNERNRGLLHSGRYRQRATNLTIAVPALPAKISHERARNAGRYRGSTAGPAYGFISSAKKNEVTTIRNAIVTIACSQRNNRERKRTDTGPCDGEGGLSRAELPGDGDADLLPIGGVNGR
jgi:hypothetical protein